MILKPDEKVVPTEFETHSSGAQRQNMKDRYDLFPFEAIESYTRVAEFGAKKYAAWNWAKGLPRMQLCASLIRHVWKYMGGEDLDLNKDGQPDDKHSGLPHVDHILWNAATLAHHHHHGIEDDRRPIPRLAWMFRKPTGESGLKLDDRFD